MNSETAAPARRPPPAHPDRPAAARLAALLALRALAIIGTRGGAKLAGDDPFEK